MKIGDENALPMEFIASGYPPALIFEITALLLSIPSRYYSSSSKSFLFVGDFYSDF
jgi:hypothetical protein